MYLHSLWKQNRTLQDHEKEALEKLNNLPAAVKQEAEEVIARLNANKADVDDIRRRLHWLMSEAENFEVVQQYKMLAHTAYEKLRKAVQPFSPSEKLLLVHGQYLI